jgi:hypothetical protein
MLYSEAPISRRFVLFYCLRPVHSRFLVNLDGPLRFIGLTDHDLEGSRLDGLAVGDGG